MEWGNVRKFLIGGSAEKADPGAFACLGIPETKVDNGWKNGYPLVLMRMNYATGHPSFKRSNAMHTGCVVYAHWRGLLRADSAISEAADRVSVVGFRRLLLLPELLPTSAGLLRCWVAALSK